MCTASLNDVQVLADDREAGFWLTAPLLFDELKAFSTELGEAVDVTPGMHARLDVIASLIPETPDDLADVDPYLRDALLTAVIQAWRAFNKEDRRNLRIAVERARQAVRDLLDEAPVWTRGPKHAVYWLVHEAGLPPSELDELLGVSEATIRRWANPDESREPGGDQADRAVVLAKIVNHLRHAMTPRGVVRWLRREHPTLEYRSPLDELKDPDSYRSLIHLASGVRSVTAS